MRLRRRASTGGTSDSRDCSSHGRDNDGGDVRGVDDQRVCAPEGDRLVCEGALACPRLAFRLGALVFQRLGGLFPVFPLRASVRCLACASDLQCGTVRKCSWMIRCFVPIRN